MIIAVNIKWGKETLKGIEVDTTSQGILFKSQIYALTSVPVTSQKIMVKGKVVKDDDELSKFGLKDGMTIMMMAPPKEKNSRSPRSPSSSSKT